MTVNEAYDGGYVGNPHDLARTTDPLGFVFGRDGPTRRVTQTEWYYFKQFHEAERFRLRLGFGVLLNGELDIDAATIIPEYKYYHGGHNRVYYHSNTMLPILPGDMDHDSEDEEYPEWVNQAMIHVSFRLIFFSLFVLLFFCCIQRIKDFTDVNEGEKTIMIIWNKFMNEHQ